MAGAGFGCYCSIKNTNGPRERAFMVKSVIVGCLLMAVFLTGLLLLPDPYRHLMWVPFGLVMGFGIPLANKKQQRIRQEEAGANDADDANKAEPTTSS